MKEFVTVILIIFVCAVIAVWACMRMAGSLSRQEDKEDGK